MCLKKKLSLTFYGHLSINKKYELLLFSSLYSNITRWKLLFLHWWWGFKYPKEGINQIFCKTKDWMWKMSWVKFIQVIVYSLFNIWLGGGKLKAEWLFCHGWLREKYRWPKLVLFFTGTFELLEDQVNLQIKKKYRTISMNYSF